MTNKDNNRFGLVGHIEFAQVTDAVKELAAMADRELASDARKAHADVTEALEELLSTIEEQKAEIKRLRMERDEARREVCDWMNTDESGCVKSGSAETAIERGWDCFKNRETL